jgi:hypothetical protein
MPVTARLSKKFYDRFGDDIANELVEWFNAVDATYRAELRELNEVNFVRFEAKLEQRVAELRAEIQSGLFGMEARLQATEARLSARIDSLEMRLEKHLEKRLTEHLRWQFVTWAALMVPILGLWFR